MKTTARRPTLETKCCLFKLYFQKYKRQNPPKCITATS
uniref:Uncharacterized protein n=1 Tax=Rhizophora mucronata TaxID=61149 RepID=A0A2P2KQI5_RHIMU